MDQIPKTNPLAKFQSNQNHKGGFQIVHLEKDRKEAISIYKSWIFDFLNLFLAAIFGLYSYRYLNNQASFLAFLFFGILFLTIVIFESAINSNWARRFGIIVLETVLFFCFFIRKEIINFVLILAIAFLILRLWGEFRTRRNFENSLEIKFLKFIKPTYSSTIAAILLVIIGFYILNFKDNQIFIPKSFFNNFWGNFSGLYIKIYPEINLGGSLNDFIKSIVILNFKDKKNDFLKGFSPEEQELILNESIAQTQKEFLKKFNLENVDPNQSFKDIIYFSLETKLENWHKSFNLFFLVIWAVFLFGLGYGLSMFLKIFLNIWFFIIFEFFLASGVINILGETKTKEVLTF